MTYLQKSTSKLMGALFDFASDSSEFFNDAIESYSSDTPQYKELPSPHPNQKPFSGQALKGIQSYELFKILTEYPKPKALVIEKEISTPLFRCIASISELKKFDVKAFCYLDDIKTTKSTYHYVYLFRPTDQNINTFKQISHNKTTHSVHLIPELPVSINKLNCLTNNFNLHIFPMSDHLLSMEQPKMLRTSKEMDPSHLRAVAESISQLQKIYGTIPNIQFVGKNAQTLADLIKATPCHALDPESIFARITIFDRVEDLFTPCMTPMTFESQIDEVLGITGQVTEIEKKWIIEKLHKWLKINPEDEDSKKIPISLDNEVYTELKHINLYNLYDALDALHKTYATKTDDIKDLVRQAKETGSTPAINMALELSNENNNKINQRAIYHNITSCIMKSYSALIRDCEENIVLRMDPEKTLKLIEQAIASKTSFIQILKLLSLFSQAHGAINPDRFHKIALSMLNAYGNTSSVALSHLKKCGMLSSINYKEKNREFHLNKNKHTYKDISNFYGGYSPLSCRHIEKLLRSPLPIPYEGLELIVFLGGCTRTEASACQLISQKAVVFTTALLTSNSFMETVLTQNTQIL